MKHEPGIFEERHPDVEAERIARARSSVNDGRFHDHAVVREWFKTFGSDHFRPFRDWLADRNG